jgi:hypothetical protein
MLINSKNLVLFPQQISIPLPQIYVVTPRAKLVCIENVRSVKTNKLLYQMGILENRSHGKHGSFEGLKKLREFKERYKVCHILDNAGR